MVNVNAPTPHPSTRTPTYNMQWKERHLSRGTTCLRACVRMVGPFLLYAPHSFSRGCLTVLLGSALPLFD